MQHWGGIVRTIVPKPVITTANGYCLGGGRLNASTTAEIVETNAFRGCEYLYYPTPRVDVAIIRASRVDDRGNVSFERDVLRRIPFKIRVADDPKKMDAALFSIEEMAQ